MKRFRTILVATDPRLEYHSIVTTAAGIASHGRASLKVAGIGPDCSWTARQTSSEQDYVRDAIEQEKQEKSDALAARFRDEVPIDLSTNAFQGKMSWQSFAKS